jgi:hypothetical protein
MPRPNPHAITFHFETWSRLNGGIINHAKQQHEKPEQGRTQGIIVCKENCKEWWQSHEREYNNCRQWVGVLSRPSAKEAYLDDAHDDLVEVQSVRLPDRET